jgi:hypothetical protein
MSHKRRDFLKAGLVLASHGLPLAVTGCAAPGPGGDRDIDPGVSVCGRWRYRQDLPEFVMTPSALPGTLAQTRLFHLMGNRALQMQAGSDGTVGLYEESLAMRWLLYADAGGGTGTSTITEPDAGHWGSARSQWPVEASPQVVFGATWFEIATAHRGLTLTRRMLCPEGDKPWVFVEVSLRLGADQAPRRILHTESWRLRPRFLHTFENDGARDTQAAAVRYRLQSAPAMLVASEDFSAVARPLGAPLVLTLESLGSRAVTMRHDDSSQPVLQADTELQLEPGREQCLWFRIGRLDGPHATPPADPQGFFAANLEALRRRLPRGKAARYPAIAHEIPWHGAALSGGANRDRLLGGHTLNQGSVYAFGAGGNAAARDALQHAIPLVHIEPDLALSVLRNTCSWGGPDGDLPYGLTAAKQPLEGLFRPSDQNLWALWLAAEYGIATGDLAAFEEALPFHPRHGIAPASLKQHLVLQFEFLRTGVGLGARGHLRILNADWNDMALKTGEVDPEAMKAEGGSVLNSAMAAWVLPVFAALLEKLGESATAAAARELAAALRQRVIEAWNGRWFTRAYAPDGRAIGEDRCWLEVQPWAILCGAAGPARARELLRTIDSRHRAGSPLGARLIWPLAGLPDAGMGTHGGIWYSVNMTLIWAAASVDPELAWDEWQRMSLRSHNACLPACWEGTLAGPDAWNSPEAARPGKTWDYPWLSMQSFPVGNMHVHSQPLLGYLRLLGVEPNSAGELVLGRGDFRSRVLQLDATGHGRLRSRGAVELRSLHGRRDGSGEVRF